MAAGTASKATPSPTRGLFDALAERGHVPLLGRTTGTLRFDLAEGNRTETWHVNVRKGDITVSQGTNDADVIVRCERALFDELATGEVNAMAAFLRGTLSAEGDLALVIQFDRLFPARLDARLRKAAAMSGDLVQILEGNTFVVSDDRGDIEASLTDPTGLFSFDTRFLSRSILTVDGCG